MTQAQPSSLVSRRLVDLGCVFALTGLALWGFDRTFADRAYLVSGLVGVGSVCAVAAFCAARQPRTDLFLLLAAALYVPVGAVAALHTLIGGRTPGGSDLLSVLTATLTSASDLLNTIPPLDSSGTVLVLPYALGYLGGGVSIWLAFRTRRALAPLVPLLLVQAVVILLAAPRPARTTLLSAAIFAGIAFWWVSSRGTEPTATRAGMRHAGRGRSLRAISAALVVAVVGVGVWRLAPASSLGGDRIMLRGRVGHGAHIDQFDNPLVNFRRFTREEVTSPDNVYDKTLLVVSGLKKPLALGFVTLDSYDGQAWRAGNKTVPGESDDLFQRIGSQVAAALPGDRISIGVQVKAGYTGAWLPLAGQLTSITFDYADGDAQRDDVRYNPATGSATVVGGLGPGNDYHFTAILPATKLGDGSRSYPTSGPLQPAGAPLDTYLEPWRRSGRAPLQQVLLLAKYLRANGRYSDGNGNGNAVVLPGESVQRLGTQFFGARRIVGDDEQYAAFMALAANRLGVPARVVLGTYTGDGKVRGRDVQAWVELRVGDGSWRILPTTTFMTHRPPRPGDQKQPPSQFVQQAHQDDQQNQQAQQQVPLPSQSSNPPAGQSPASGSLISRHPYPVALLLLFVLGWAVPSVKALRRLARRRISRQSARVAGAWRELLDSARDLGVAVPEGRTRLVQARVLRLDPSLAVAVDDRIFGVELPTAAEATEVWRAMDEQRQVLTRRQPGWRRLLAPFNPASLVRRADRAPVTRTGRRRVFTSRTRKARPA